MMKARYFYHILRRGLVVLRLLFRILLFLPIIGLLLWGTSEYILSISDNVLAILANIQQKGLMQEMPDIMILIILLAIPFLIFLVPSHLFMKSIMRRRDFPKIKRKTVGRIKSVRQTGIFVNEQPEVKIVVDAVDGKK